jgi:hypothetical protein
MAFGLAQRQHRTQHEQDQDGRTEGEFHLPQEKNVLHRAADHKWEYLRGDTDLQAWTVAEAVRRFVEGNSRLYRRVEGSSAG